MVENRAPVPLADVVVSAVLIDGNGAVAQQGPPVRVGRALQPGERVALDAGVGAVAPDLLNRVRIRVEGARAMPAP